MKSTKELARELGIIRKRTLNKSCSAEEDRKRAKKSCQIFSFLIVLDFESTCWQGEKNRAQEIIEFPAVLLNLETGVVESEFHRYVQPQENPTLSEFCRQLTGITQDQVDEAAPLFICLRQFTSWLKELSASKMLSFSNSAGAGKPTAFVTWSDWDLGVCLQYECRRKQLRKPVELCSWIDLRATYRRHYQRKPKGLNGALQELGINFEGREHSGLDDARNTSFLAWKMVCDGCVMEITKTQTESVAGRSSTLHPITNIPSLNSSSKNQVDKPQTQKVDQCQAADSLLFDSNVMEKVAICSGVTTFPDVSSDNKENVDWGWDEIDDDSILKYVCSNSPSWRNSVTTQNTTDSVTNLGSILPTASKISSSIQTLTVKELHVDGKRNVLRNITNSLISNRGIEPNVTKLIRSPKTSKILSLTEQVQCINNPRSVSSRVDGKSTPKKQNENFTVISSKLPSAKGSNSISVKVSSNGARLNSVACGDRTKIHTPAGVPPTRSVMTPTPLIGTGTFRTPSSGLSTAVPLSSSMRKTPPMCECGCRAKRKYVQSPGPNFGKAFFCCGGQQRSSRSGCKFFRWETASLSPLNSSKQTSFVNKMSPSISPLQQPRFDTPSSVLRPVTRSRFTSPPNPQIRC